MPDITSRPRKKRLLKDFAADVARGAAKDRPSRQEHVIRMADSLAGFVATACLPHLFSVDEPRTNEAHEVICILIASAMVAQYEHDHGITHQETDQRQPEGGAHDDDLLA